LAAQSASLLAPSPRILRPPTRGNHNSPAAFATFTSPIALSAKNTFPAVSRPNSTAVELWSLPPDTRPGRPAPPRSLRRRPAVQGHAFLHRGRLLILSTATAARRRRRPRGRRHQREPPFSRRYGTDVNAVSPASKSRARCPQDQPAPEPRRNRLFLSTTGIILGLDAASGPKRDAARPHCAGHFRLCTENIRRS
jgi:hypothetical protein